MTPLIPPQANALLQIIIAVSLMYAYFLSLFLTVTFAVTFLFKRTRGLK